MSLIKQTTYKSIDALNLINLLVINLFMIKLILLQSISLLPNIKLSLW